MSQALIEKMLKARESGVSVGEKTYTILRPTDEDVVGLQGKPAIQAIKQFVVGWELTELDFYSGGSSEKVPFHSGLWANYIGDHPELWGPLGDAISEAYYKHVAAREDAAKN